MALSYNTYIHCGYIDDSLEVFADSDVDQASLFTGVLAHSYAAPAGFNFDMKAKDPPIMVRSVYTISGPPV